MLAHGRGDTGIQPLRFTCIHSRPFPLFKNADMLTNIRRSTHVIRALTNGVTRTPTWLGLPKLGEVWYNRESMANILSLAEVRKVCRVTMDSSTSPQCLSTASMDRR
jgi:hypothetical protein